MPTLTKYSFQQAYDIPSLTYQIKTSSIVTVLDYIDASVNETDVWFKDVLSNTDQTTLTTVINNYVYINPPAYSPLKVVQVLGADSLTLSPFGAIINPTAGTLTNCDIALPTAMVLRGGSMFSNNSSVGDWISISVIDKDNVIGAGGTPNNPTVLGIYVIGWYMMPGIENRLEDISVSQNLPQGVYMRISYTSVGNVNPKVVINFISYVSNV